MATYTTNYQLHQWEPEDPFLRTDFNTDLLKLDEGLTRQAEVSACLGYEALQSRLLTDAAGKPAADGRGLLFDSFRTGARAAFGGGCGLKNGGGVLLDTGTGLISFSDHYGADESYYLGETASTQCTFTAAGNGTLDSLSLYLRGKEGASVKLAIRQDSAELWSTTKALTTEVQSHTFQPRLRLQKGAVYTIYAQRSGGSLWVYCAAGGGPIGYSAVCTPAAGTSGTVTGALCSRTPCRSASAWVRHIGGNVQCALQRDGGAYEAMEEISARQTVSARGESCKETEFRLPVRSAPSGTSIRARITIQSTTDATICDYGVVLV